MKIVLILMLFTILLLIGCNNTMEEPVSEDRWIFPADMWEQMESVFKAVEDELVHFVAYLKENELFDTLEGVSIIFKDNEESDLEEANRATSSMSVTAYNGEILNLDRLWGTVSIFRDDPILSDLVRAIGERGIIARIAVSGGTDDVSIWFLVKPEHPYIADIRGWENNFYYIEGDPPTWRDLEQIRENWYMEIAIP
jgi:hypothetical protein